jgi:hypothetical protein
VANNAPYALGPTAPGVRMNSVVVNAGTVAYNPPLTKLYAGGAGDVTIVSPATGTVTLGMVAGGSLSDVGIYQVTTATATGLIGFF